MEAGLQKIIFLVIAIAFVLISESDAQSKKVRINSIVVDGNKKVDASSIRFNSGLMVGSEVNGEDLQRAVKNLWVLRIFSDISLYITGQSLQGLDLLIKVKEYPRLNNIVINGAKQLSEKDIKEEINTYRGMVITPYKLFNIKNKILDKYHDEGYLLAEVNIDTVKSKGDNRVDMVVDLNEGDEVQIENITFHGNDNIDSDDLLDAMDDIQEDRWWRSADFDPKKLKSDIKKIIEYYKNQGYRDAEIIRDSLSYNEDKTDLYIDIWVYEGEKYYYGDISFEGSDIFGNEELKSIFEIEKGQPFDQEEFNTARQRIQDLYYNQGYLFANIQPHEIPVSDDTLNINFTIIEGHVVHINKIIIKGNSRTNEKVIRRELKIHPGNVFNSAKLQRSARDVQMLNYFADILPNVELIPGEESKVNLTLSVEEKSTDMANMSAGYSQRDGLIGSLGLTFNNFSMAHPFSGGDGQRLDFNWQFGSIYRSFSISFTEPWLFDTPTLGGFSVFDTRSGGGYYPWDQASRGGSLRLGRRFYWPDNFFRGDWIARYTLSSITNITDPDLLSYYPRYTAGITEQISITQIISRDSRDNPEFPTHGSNNSFLLEYSGGLLGGDKHYVKSIFSSEWFMPMPLGLVLFSRFKAGIINEASKNKVPLFGEYFYMGGSGMSFSEGLRGYDDGQVGPVSSNGSPIGGSSMGKVTMELRFQIAPNPTIFGLLFAEGGNTWSEFGETNIFDFRRSAGVGVRMFMPMIGIIGVDFGYGFDYYDYFGRRQGQWKVHFVFGKF